MSAFDDVKRILAAVAALALLALNDVRFFHLLPTAADPGNGRTHALTLQLFGDVETVYLTGFDLVLRWGLFGLVVAACLWAFAETLKPAQAKNGERHSQ